MLQGTEALPDVIFSISMGNRGEKCLTATHEDPFFYSWRIRGENPLKTGRDPVAPIFWMYR
jgi:hypothetical protein